MTSPDSPSPRLSGSRARKSPIRKTRTFDGCWTCRRRKVKCDLERPACTRCRKGRYHCGGYGLLLHWTENSSGIEEDTFSVVRGNAVKRKAMLTLKFASWELDMRRVEELLTEIDELNDSDDRVMGPFSIFHIQNSSLTSISVDRAVELLHESYTEPDRDSPSSAPSSVYGPLYQLSPQMQVLPVSLPAILAFPSVTRLFYHYMNHVTDLLQPVTHTGNFYSAVYVPRAISGAWSLVSTDSKSRASWSSRSIFFSILATSAFHLRGINGPSETTSLGSHALTERTEEMDRIGTRCRMMAYRYLRSALTEGLNSHDAAEAAMSAILSFISIDVMHGSMSEFFFHLSAFQALQIQYNQKRQDWADNTPKKTSSSTERYLSTIFYLQSTLSLSTNPDLVSVSWPSDSQRSLRRERTLYSTPILDQDCLQYTYGTTQRLAIFIRAITTLFRSVTYYLTTETEIPNTLRQAIYTLSNELDGWTLDSETIIALPNAETTRVMSLHILSFYHATRIFHYTHLILPLSMDHKARHRPRPSQELHYHVSQVLYLLQSIETVKRQNPRIFNSHNASILWPGFIASCEAAEEHTAGWLEWWEHMLTYRIGNIAPLYETVRDAWQFRNLDQNGYSWLPRWRALLIEKRRAIIAL